MATCCRCSVDISEKDLVSGLALRIPTGLVCAGCIDTMHESGASLAALRGIGEITYSVRLARLPTLKLFSFTTSGGITKHRLSVLRGVAFKTPPLPRPELLKAQIERARTLERTRRTKAIIVLVAAAAALAIGIAIAIFNLLPEADKNAVTPHARDAYPIDPSAALTIALQDANCPPEVMEQILRQVREQVLWALKSSEQSLNANDRATALQRLNSIAEPLLVHPQLVDLVAPLKSLRTRIHDGPQTPHVRPDPSLALPTVPRAPPTVTASGATVLSASATVSPAPAPATTAAYVIVPPIPPVELMVKPPLKAERRPVDPSATVDPISIPAAPPSVTATSSVSEAPATHVEINPISLKKALGDATAFALLDTFLPGTSLPGCIIPAPWPSGYSRFTPVRRLLPGRSLAGIDLPFDPGTRSIILHLHPNDLQRTKLSIRVGADKKYSTYTDLGMIVLSATAGWQRVVITLPEDLPENSSLALEDTIVVRNDNPYPLVLAKAVATDAANPDASIAPLPAITLHFPLMTTLSTLTAVRSIVLKVSNSSNKELLNRDRLISKYGATKSAIVLVNASGNEEWRGAMREAMNRKGERNAVEDLSLAPGWWEAKQFDLDSRGSLRTLKFEPIAPLTPKGVSFVVFIPGGNEITSDLLSGSKLTEWAMKLAVNVREGNRAAKDPSARQPGLCPIFVFGAVEPMTPEQNRALIAAWKDAGEKLPLNGVPVIDLTSAQRATKQDMNESTTQLIAEALEQIRYQFLRMAPALKQQF